MKYIKEFKKKLNESKLEDSDEVFIEPIASASDFSSFIDSLRDELGFNSDDFWDNMNMWEEGTLSSRYSKKFCQSVLDEGRPNKKYYKAIVLLFDKYPLSTIRFYCDW